MVTGNPFNESFNSTDHPNLPGSNFNNSFTSASDQNSSNSFVHISNNTDQTSEEKNSVEKPLAQNYDGVEELLMLGLLHTMF